MEILVYSATLIRVHAAKAIHIVDTGTFQTEVWCKIFKTLTVYITLVLTREWTYVGKVHLCQRQQKASIAVRSQHSHQRVRGPMLVFTPVEVAGVK